MTMLCWNSHYIKLLNYNKAMEVYAKMTNNDPHGHENIRPQSSGGTTERSVRSVPAGAERGRGTGRNTVNSRKSVVRRGAGGRTLCPVIPVLPALQLFRIFPRRTTRNRLEAGASRFA